MSWIVQGVVACNEAQMLNYTSCFMVLGLDQSLETGALVRLETAMAVEWK